VRASSLGLLFASLGAASIGGTLTRSAQSAGIDEPESTVALGGAHLSLALDRTTGTLWFRACSALPCRAREGEGLPVELDGAGTLRAERVEGSDNAALVVVGRTDKRPGGWHALIALDAGRHAQALFSGRDGLWPGGSDDGSRVVREGGQLVVGELRRGIGMCGQPEALIAPRRFDPKRGLLAPVALERLPAAVRASATTLVATIDDATPVGSVLGARGATSNDGATPRLVDGDPSTSWTETRRGDGRGELVVFSAPKSLPLASLSIVVRPSGAAPAGFSAVKTAWVGVDGAIYRVELPSVATPGARVTVRFPAPVATSCVSLEVEATEEEGDVAAGFAEVEGVPVLPASIKKLDDLVGLLDLEGDGGKLAREVLVHGGAAAAKGLLSRIGALGPRGKEVAIDVFEAAPCRDGAPGLARLAWDGARDIALSAREGLDACGREGRDAIAAAFAQGPTSAREVLADRFAKLDPAAALEAIVGVMSGLPAERRRTLRHALTRVADAEAGRAALTRWLSRPPAAPTDPNATDVVIELARGVVGARGMVDGVDAPALRASLAALLASRAAATAPFAQRFLALEPLAALAMLGDSTAERALEASSADADRYIRARATELAADVPSMRGALDRASRDADPRVRAFAIAAIAKQSPAQAGVLLVRTLHEERWTFVRVAAADASATLGADATVDKALIDALADEAPTVRAASVRALAARHATSALVAIRKRAFDDAELMDVRREAVAALGAMCDRGAVDGLQHLAEHGGGSEGAASLALSAVASLGVLHPADLLARLAGVDRTAMVMSDAVRRALAEKNVCR
jgi:hypothetical protein